ncbi:Transcriptional regulator, GntR family [Pimelobacter simplex]|uniref:Transcriptional regulator, GntR family n=2 Tax=Nocardioides simplex TaxID=2045 RepID=A0A0A1DWU1_NOCSI|nr:Transcriptional regulator, GntR family [Pimelobacter simplex]
MMEAEWGPGDLRPRSVAGEVAILLEREIRSGRFGPGERLPSERELATRLGVSRTSVRDAMQELTLKGLIDRRPGRGTVVVEHASPLEESLLSTMGAPERSLREVTDLRRAIEAAVAERAALRATKTDLASLAACLDRAHDRLPADESLRLDEEFHLLVARATQNPLLVTLVETTAEWLVDVRRRSHLTRAGRRASIAGHRDVLDAIAAGDTAAARLAMVAHVAEISQVIRAQGH